jgi:hypothetical protein
MKKTRFDAAKELWKDFISFIKEWWSIKSKGDTKDQNVMWVIIISILSVFLGIIICPRFTILSCLIIWIYTKIEERR